MTQSAVSFQTATETQDAEVQMAAHAFAQALAESAEFQAFEQASERLRQDETAQEAILAFQNKQQSLQMMLRLNAVKPAGSSRIGTFAARLPKPAIRCCLSAGSGRT